MLYEVITSFFFERNGKCIEVGNFWGMEYFEKPTIFRNENRETYYLFIEARYKNLLFIFYDYEPETQYENYNKNA